MAEMRPDRDEMLRALATRLREARGSESIRSLARRIGVDHAIIIRAEQARRMPRVETIVALADALDRSIEWLLGLE